MPKAELNAKGAAITKKNMTFAPELIPGGKRLTNHSAPPLFWSSAAKERARIVVLFSVIKYSVPSKSSIKCSSLN